MIQWRSSLDMPDVECGTRIAVIVSEVLLGDTHVTPRIVMLTATEDGWESDEETYVGYSPGDGVAWCLEEEILDTHVTEEST